MYKYLPYIQKPIQQKLNTEKYPTDGICNDILCTCKDTCYFNCKGECGCQACQEAYADFLSEE